MAESKACKNTSPHRQHDYTDTAVKDGKLTVVTYTCPGVPMPGTAPRRKK